MIVHQILDFVFPRNFSVQGDISSSVPMRLEGEKLHSMGITSLDRLVAVSYYKDPKMRNAIATLKYRRVRSLAEPLGTLLLPALQLLSPPPYSILCPVPLHWTRLLLRGFNQSALLARKVSEQSGIPVQTLLRRAIPTGHQTHRNIRERVLSMKKVFRSMVSHSSPVILIDDVATSGATLDACAQALKESGIRWVGAVVLALG